MINIQTRGQQAKARLDEIKSLYKIGKVSYDEARKFVLPPVLQTLSLFPELYPAAG